MPPSADIGRWPGPPFWKFLAHPDPLLAVSQDIADTATESNSPHKHVDLTHPVVRHAQLSDGCVGAHRCHRHFE